MLLPVASEALSYIGRVHLDIFYLFFCYIYTNRTGLDTNVGLLVSRRLWRDGRTWESASTCDADRVMILDETGKVADGRPDHGALRLSEWADDGTAEGGTNSSRTGDVESRGSETAILRRLR